ncbi:unnamed protein product [Ambrosiozyma monospora]|uniref:Unnamed protein product n=1 Tax=Ambrosiozyma monospora TaxID=43982 RepID=A0ACB5U913_AMBMO|nr:unnamed protein product [Ambrosiozyma monospora]
MFYLWRYDSKMHTHSDNTLRFFRVIDYSPIPQSSNESGTTEPASNESSNKISTLSETEIGLHNEPNITDKPNDVPGESNDDGSPPVAATDNSLGGSNDKDSVMPDAVHTDSNTTNKDSELRDAVIVDTESGKNSELRDAMNIDFDPNASQSTKSRNAAIPTGSTDGEILIDKDASASKGALSYENGNTSEEKQTSSQDPAQFLERDDTETGLGRNFAQIERTTTT